MSNSGKTFRLSLGTIAHVEIAVAVMLIFLLQHTVTGFLAPGHHGYLSSHGMTIAANLSLQNPFFMYEEKMLTPDGAVQYVPYNRFPIGTFALIKLGIELFPNSLSLQITAAYALMNVFFALAMYTAYLSLYKLGQNKLVAATATLLAFSSYYCLHYKDMIFNDVPTLFGLTLIFHGMVMYVQESAFKQLVLKSLLALMLGWQAYALLMPFVLFGCIREARTLAKASLVKNPFFALGLIAVLFGFAILSLNFAVEYLALRLPLDQLPTYRSMIWRFGLDAAETYKRFESALHWPSFLYWELYRIGAMSLPGMVSDLLSRHAFVYLGGGVTLLVIVMAGLAKERLLLVPLALSGLCWALPMHAFVAFHDFQSLYYLGIPLVFFYLILMMLYRKSEYIVLGVSSAALFMYALSLADKMQHAETSLLTADFQLISDILKKEKRVYIVNRSGAGAAKRAVNYYLAGNYLQPDAESAEFIISDHPQEEAELLTPDNKKVFLYKRP